MALDKKTKLSRNQKVDLIASHFEVIMETLGLDILDPSLKDTPMRVARMYVDETCRSIGQKPPKITVFPNDRNYDQMIIVKKLDVTSLCEHHFQNIIGECNIAYLPKGYLHDDGALMGLSKFSRIVKHFSAKPQVQERLTQEIADYVCKVLHTEDVAVFIEAEHHCMRCRGVYEKNSTTVTSYMGGAFRDALKSEFLNLINK
jgi:GTP cyclohydrolase I